jgi:hypothetical protein
MRDLRRVAPMKWPPDLAQAVRRKSRQLLESLCLGEHSGKAKAKQKKVGVETAEKNFKPNLRPENKVTSLA